MEVNYIAALSLFCLTFIGIFSGQLHRSIASFAGAIGMVLAGEFLGFYTQEEALSAVNFNTIELLVGMMIVVGTLKRTGFFEYLSIIVAKKAGKNQFSLFLALCGLTAISSAILDNVTTIVLVAPMTLAITEILGVSPVPYLMGEAMTSIIGGMATLVGDPPNIIIGSEAGLSFNSFLIHLGPVSVLIWICSVFIFWLFFKFKPVPPQKVEDLRGMNAQRALEDRKSAGKLLAVIGMVVILYMTHSYLGIEAGLVALIGAASSLLLVKPEVKEILEDVEWDAILFLAGLFVVVGGLESVGLLSKAAEGLEVLLKGHQFIAPIGLLWIAGILSAVIDNIPFTVAMVPIIIQLQAAGGGTYLWWGLAMGAALGGAASPVGSSANVVAMSISERSANKISSRDWIKIGAPVAALNLVIASLMLMLMSWIGY